MPVDAAAPFGHSVQQPWFLLRPGSFIQQHASTFTRGLDSRQRTLCLQLLPVLCVPEPTNSPASPCSFQPGTQALDLKLHRDVDGTWGGVESLTGLAAAFPQQGLPNAGAVWCAGVQQDPSNPRRWFLYINASEERPAFGIPVCGDCWELAMQEDDCYLLNKHLSALDVHRGWCVSGAPKSSGVPFRMTFLLDGRPLVDGRGELVQRSVTVGPSASRRLQCVEGGTLRDALQEAQPAVDAAALRSCGVRVSTAPDGSQVFLQLLLVSSRGGSRKRGAPDGADGQAAAAAGSNGGGGGRKSKRPKTSHLRMVLETFPHVCVVGDDYTRQMETELGDLVEKDIINHIVQNTQGMKDLTQAAVRRFVQDQQCKRALEAAIPHASSRIAELEEELQRARGRCAQAEARRSSLAAQLELLRKKLRGLGGYWQALHGGVRSVLQRLTAQHAEACAACSAAESAREETAARLEVAMVERAALQRQLDGLNTSLSEHLYNACLKTVTGVLQAGLCVPAEAPKS